MTIDSTSPFIYLASQSPRRAELLAQLGIAHQLLLADPDEDVESLEAIRGKEKPLAYVQRVVPMKLVAAMQRAKLRGVWGNAPILCADTTVALGTNILGKPTNDEHAAQMLSQLAGQTHRVLSCVGMVWRDQPVFATSISSVTFAQLSPSDIAAYIATGEPFGKAGSYGVQGRAAAFITKISGSYSGIMGLPLHETSLLLKQVGAL